MRGQAYQQGLNLSQQGISQDIGALQGMGALGGTQLGEGLQGIGNASNMYGQAAGVLGNAGNLYGMASNMYGQAGSNLGNAAGMINTGVNSGVSANNLQSNLNNYPWQNLANYYGILGANNWGSQSAGNANTTAASNTSGSGTSFGNSQTQNNPSALSTAGSLVGLLGSIF
jgi:hypothetical protein